MVVFEREFMTKKISQREAHRLRKKVKELENQLKNDYAGTRITSVVLCESQFACVKTAHNLGHQLRVVPTWAGNEVKVMAQTL